MKHVPKACLAAAICVSLWLNFRGIHWGIVQAPSGAVFLLHPDEDANMRTVRALRGSGRCFLRAEADIWPYDYKGLLYYTGLRAMAFAARLEPGSPAFQLAGRSISAVLGAVGVWLLWRLGLELGGPWLGALAAVFLASSPGWAANAHYLTQDVPVTVLILAALLACVKREGAALGVLAGLAIAAKHSAWPLVVPAALSLRGSGRRAWLEAGGWFLAALAAADPILWAAPGDVWRGLGMLAEVNRNGIAYRLARPPGWIDYAVSVLPYAAGRPLAAFSVLSLFIFAAKGPKGRAPLLAWLAAYWVVLGFDNARLVRYLVPVAPILCLAAAFGLLWAWEKLPRARWLAAGLGAACAAAAFLDSAAYTAAMRRPDPREQAFRWFMERVPPPALVAVPRLDFSRLPTPQGGSVEEVGYDWGKLSASKADWFAHSDFDWLEYQEAGVRSPREAGFIDRVASGGDWKLTAKFENPRSFLGWEVRKGWPPHDWLYPDAAITIYRRSLPPARS